MTFYHGTKAGFRRGGYLFPQSDTGHRARPGHVGDYSTSYVYFTTDRELAEWYAINSVGRGKPKVLVVQPLGPVTVDPSTYDGEEGQYRCSFARVVEVLPVSEEALQACGS